MRLRCNIITSRNFPIWLPAFLSRAASPFFVSPSTSAFVGGPEELNRASGLWLLGRWGLRELQQAPGRKLGRVYVPSLELTMILFAALCEQLPELPVGSGRWAATPPILRLSCGQSARGPARDGFDGLAGSGPPRANFGEDTYSGTDIFSHLPLLNVVVERPWTMEPSPVSSRLFDI